jgi:hypothetical protein
MGIVKTPKIRRMIPEGTSFAMYGLSPVIRRTPNMVVIITDDMVM